MIILAFYNSQLDIEQKALYKTVLIFINFLSSAIILQYYDSPFSDDSVDIIELLVSSTPFIKTFSVCFKDFCF